MLRQVAEGVLIHQSEFCQSNAVVVQGRDGALLVDAGIYGYEMDCLANDLSESGQTVVAGFSTHFHWDHVLWHTRFGAASRYGTARSASTIRDLLSGPRWKDSIAGMIPPDIAEQISWDLFGLITGLPAETARIPWNGRDLDGPEEKDLGSAGPRPASLSTVVLALGGGRAGVSRSPGTRAVDRWRCPVSGRPLVSLPAVAPAQATVRCWRCRLW